MLREVGDAALAAPSRRSPSPAWSPASWSASLQVGFKPSAHALKPDPKKLNPMSGAKHIFGTHALFETAKSIVKVVVVGAIAALAVLPKLEELAALVGMPPAGCCPARRTRCSASPSAPPPPTS